ncbi:MAG: hypothetical protein GY868_11345 [Deltaproteobacteria bacterium]|nr:hypothetical protein [Deltaproteobacteria bacterium]
MKQYSDGGTRLPLKVFRISFLLIVLVGIGAGAWLTKLRVTGWDDPLRVVVYPINGDGSSAAESYIEALTPEVFGSVEQFMQDEGEQFGLSVAQPVSLRLAPEVTSLPPAPPFGGMVLETVLWSLQLRYWAWQHDTYQGAAAEVKLFVAYFDPDDFERLSDSLGLQKGLIGVVYAYADRRFAEKDNVIIAHEMLHTLGATDKYDPVTRQPLFPGGFADPEREPLLPQDLAEIMAGRRPLADNETAMPESLYDVVIGEQTAREIRWIR